MPGSGNGEVQKREQNGPLDMDPKRLVLNANKDTGAYLNELANAEKARFDPFGVVTVADGVRQGNSGDVVIGILSSITRVRNVTSTIGKSAGLSRLAEEAGSSVQKSLDTLVGQLERQY